MKNNEIAQSVEFDLMDELEGISDNLIYDIELGDGARKGAEEAEAELAAAQAAQKAKKQAETNLRNQFETQIKRTEISLSDENPMKARLEEQFKLTHQQVNAILRDNHKALATLDYDPEDRHALAILTGVAITLPLAEDAYNSILKALHKLRDQNDHEFLLKAALKQQESSIISEVLDDTLTDPEGMQFYIDAAAVKIAALQQTDDGEVQEYVQPPVSQPEQELSSEEAVKASIADREQKLAQAKQGSLFGSMGINFGLVVGGFLINPILGVGFLAAAALDTVITSRSAAVSIPQSAVAQAQQGQQSFSI